MRLPRLAERLSDPRRHTLTCAPWSSSILQLVAVGFAKVSDRIDLDTCQSIVRAKSWRSCRELPAATAKCPSKRSETDPLSFSSGGLLALPFGESDALLPTATSPAKWPKTWPSFHGQDRRSIRPRSTPPAPIAPGESAGEVPVDPIRRAVSATCPLS